MRPFLLATLALLAPALAHAGLSPRECVAANERGNTASRAHKLLAAEKEMLACADPTCPEEVRVECDKDALEIARAIPSLVVRAQDASGHDLVDVKITLDGALFATHLDGAPIDVDPGAHDLVLEAPGQPGAVRRNLVVAEGEKARTEILRFAPAKHEAPAPSTFSPRKTFGLATMITGAVGLGLALVAGGLAMSNWSTSQSACTSGLPCSSANAYSTANGAYQTGKTWADVSTAAFIAGGVVFAVGGVLFFTAPVVVPGKASAFGLDLGVAL